MDISKDMLFAIGVLSLYASVTLNLCTFSKSKKIDNLIKGSSIAVSGGAILISFFI